MKLFRQPDQEPVQQADILERGQRDWDARVSDAIAGRTAFKRCLYAVSVALVVSVSGNVWQGAQSKIQIVHVVHDSVGDVIAVSVSTDPPGGPSQAMLKAALETWITDVRSVYVDANALRRSILDAYKLVDDHSQASALLASYYLGQDPFKRAETETVSLENVVAIPPTEATIGPDSQQTWRITWVEVVTSRDGQTQTGTPWAGNITFKMRTPANAAEAKRDPDGVYILAFSWTGK